MGLFKKLKEMGGSPSSDLLEHGLLGRGLLIGAEPTRVSTGPEGFEKPVYVFTVEVTLDNTPTYQAQCRQAVPTVALAQLVPGQTVMAVRVDPGDQSHIALDLGTEPPTVTVQGQGAGAAEVLARGLPVRAVIVQTQPLGMKNKEGVDLHAFLLTVLQEGKAPYQAKVGNPVPTEAVPLLYPGANVPAKVLPEEPEGVVIDWSAAIAEFTKK
jgi:hypothetical protein